jgi:ribonuclease HI
MYGWAANGWKKADNKIPENLELIKTYYELEEKGFSIDLQKIAGHAGNKWNELADAIATGRYKK